MNNIRFIFECKSNHVLDTFTQDIISIIKSTGAVKTGPVCFKGKRLLDGWNCNHKTVDALMKIRAPKGLSFTISLLEKSR